MTKKIYSLFSVFLCISLMFCLTSCKKSEKKANGDSLWENATYTEDTTLGKGDKKITVEVKAGEKTVTFTLKTDKKTVGEALYENKLVDDMVFAKKVNGIVADYDKDKTYWGFFIDGEYALKGMNETGAEQGKVYRLERTK